MGHPIRGNYCRLSLFGLFTFGCSEYLVSDITSKEIALRGHRLIELLTDKEKEIMIKITKTGIFATSA